MNRRSIPTLAIAVMVAMPLWVQAGDDASQASKSSQQAPVSQPETDPAVSNSGKLVPGQPVRPEAQEEASVPKTRMDKSAASSADVGSEKTNTKANHSSSGADTTNAPKQP